MSYINRFDGRWNFLSNFYPVEIEYQGIKYPSVEHYYVAQKCKNDQMIDGVYYTSADFKEMISKIHSPGHVKKLGQKMKVRSDWSEKKLEFMNWGVREKFKNEKNKIFFSFLLPFFFSFCFFTIYEQNSDNFRWTWNIWKKFSFLCTVNFL